MAKSMIRVGRPFYKMSGSGNDFIFFDLRDGPIGYLSTATVIQEMCARGTGVGADGVVFFDRSEPCTPSIRYYNSDGSNGELCGNATLCTVRLSELLGARCEGFTIRTDSGDVAARLVDGLPEIDLEPVTGVQPDAAAIPPADSEKRLGYAVVGVPHVVIEVPDVSKVDVLGRGSKVRRDRSLAIGANVNFLAPATDGSWMIRTYERGVEGETLACGTGAVASAILLEAWGRAASPVRLVTKSGRTLTVRLRRDGDLWFPSLCGSADLVYIGQFVHTD